MVPFKLLEEADKANDEDGFVKESDLKNHLEGQAEPKGKPDAEEKEAPSVNGAESRVNPLEMDNLKRDNQIMRALDILVSYDLFKHLGS